MTLLSLLSLSLSAGKTLSYGVPVVQSLQALQPKVSRSDGPLAVVIVPTREVCLGLIPLCFHQSG